MADRELAMKLAERFHKLSFDMNQPEPLSRGGMQQVERQHTVIPEPPPAPVPPPVPPPFATDNEWTDMDKLISQTLHNLEVTSRTLSNNALSTKDYAPKPLRKPSPNILETFHRGIFCIFMLKMN